MKIRTFIFLAIAVFHYSQSHAQSNETVGNSYLSTGIWMPNGKLSALGNHPFLGLSAGLKFNKFSVNWVLNARFFKSANFYNFKYQDSIHSTNDFFGGYMGFDFGYELLKYNKLSFTPIIGIGYDGIDALFPEAYQDMEASTHSYNFNLGFCIKYHTKKHRHWGLQAKYNLVDHTLGDRTNLSGNAFTICILKSILTDIPASSN